MQGRCEGCAEVGHAYEDCPHRNSSEEEKDDGDEDGEEESETAGSEEDY